MDWKFENLNFDNFCQCLAAFLYLISAAAAPIANIQPNRSIHFEKFEFQNRENFLLASLNRENFPKVQCELENVFFQFF